MAESQLRDEGAERSHPLEVSLIARQSEGCRPPSGLRFSVLTC